MKYPKLIITLAVIAFMMLIVWVAIFLQNFHCVYIPDFSEWGSFGDFFWGLGTMLLTGLNVYVFYKLTVAYENSKEKRDKAIFKLQKEQIENEQRMALIREIGDCIGEARVTFKLDGETRTKIHYTLNRIQVFHTLFPSIDLEKQLLPLNMKVNKFDDEKCNAWLKEKHNGQEIFFPVNERAYNIIKELADLEALMWFDFNNIINNPQKSNPKEKQTR